MKSILLPLLILIIEIYAHYQCIHDKLPQQPPIFSAQHYPEMGVFEDTEWNPIRIHIKDYLDVDLSTDTKKKEYLRNILLNMTLFVSEELQVQTVQGNLTLSRRCSAFYQSKKCKSFESASCGLIDIPDVYYKNQTYCPENEEECYETEFGPGADADYL